MNKNYYCVIMAGGIGSRFWPVSRNSKPKQFLDILGVGRSFLQTTYDRFAQIVPKENILVVTSKQYAQQVKEQLPEVLDENILNEPYRRNTAPCIAYATYKLYARNPDATVVVSPSDHLIIGEKIFIDTVSNALEFAEKNDYLLTIGIRPTHPDTNYGYIQADMRKFKNFNGNPAFPVKTFTEKPNEDLAKVFIDSGEFFWNSGMFIWNLKTIIFEMEKLLPEVADLFKEGKDYFNTDREEDFVLSAYEDCTNISIDYGVMEKTAKAWVFQASFGWSDMGTWTALYNQSPDKDAAGNVVKSAGDSLIDKKLERTLVANYEKDKLVVVKGLKDYLVVNTEDVLLVCPLQDSSVKNVLTDLALRNDTKYI